MYKALVFDMDGTIADLYNVDGWLDRIENEDTTPYEIAKPMVDMFSLDEILKRFSILGWKIIINSWTSKSGSDEYNARVRETKLEWLNRMNFPYDEVYITNYGITKDNATKEKGGIQILIDDNAEIRREWSLGETINPEEHLMKTLVDLLVKEMTK